jgi:amino acid permease
MTDQTPKMKPIWFFVGVILLVMGAVILGSGIYDLVRHVESNKVLGRLHPAVWWGGLMTVFGLLFVWLNRKSTVD